MAETFQPILTNIGASGLPAAPVSQGLPTAEALTGAAVTGIEVARAASDIGQVNEFKKAINDITQAKVRTDEQIAGITAELEGADRATVARLGRQLSLLATGQEQGSLTNTQATARASVEFRKAAASNPRIEQELRQVLKFSTFGGSAGGAKGSETNPLVKAAVERENMIVGIMFKGNITRNAAESFLQSQQDFEQIKLSNDIAMAQSVAGFTSIIGAVGASAQQVQYSMLGDLNVALTEAPGSFDPNMFKASVTQTFLSLERDWSQRMANSGKQFTSAQRKEVSSVFRDTRDMMIAIGDAKDPKLHMDRINSILDAEEKVVAARLLKHMGPMFQSMRVLGSPEQVFNTLFNIIPKALGQQEKDSGKFDALVQAAEDSGDTDMIFALQYAQSNPTLTVRQWRDQLNGVFSGTQAQIEFNRNISAQVINSTPPQGEEDSGESKKAIEYLMKNADNVLNSEIPTNVSATYQPGFANRMAQEPKLAQRVRNQVANRMALKTSVFKDAIGALSSADGAVRLVVDEKALANPILTKTGLFRRGLEAASIFKMVRGEGVDISSAGKVPFVLQNILQRKGGADPVGITPTSGTFLVRDLRLMDEYVATLTASGMDPSAIRREIEQVLKNVNGEELAKKGAPVGETIGEVTRDPFSFLRGATDEELSTLEDNAVDAALLSALKRERARR